MKVRDVYCSRPGASSHSRCRCDRPKPLGLKKWNRLLTFVRQVLSVEDSIFPGCDAVLFRGSRRFDRTKILPECRKLQSVHRAPELASDMLSICSSSFCAKIVIFAHVLLDIFLCWQLAVIRSFSGSCFFGVQLLVGGVGKISLSQCPERIVTCRKGLDLEVTPCPSHVRSIGKVLSNWESTICWCTVRCRTAG
jgi:hypothetical protein